MKILGFDTSTQTAGIAIVEITTDARSPATTDRVSTSDRVLAEVRHHASGRSADLLVKTDRVSTSEPVLAEMRHDASGRSADLLVKIDRVSTSERVLAELRHDASGRSADLLVKIDELCRAATVLPSELDAIAVGAGPGSFTGLRIGMATAKGIAFAANRPLWAVSSLAALAHDARGELVGKLAMADGVICAAIDARRGEVFAGCFRFGVPLAPERTIAPDELAAWVTKVCAACNAEPAATHFAGNARNAYRDQLDPLIERWLSVQTPSGVAVATLAVTAARIDITRDGAPNYIRASEAEVKYPDGVPGALPKR